MPESFKIAAYASLGVFAGANLAFQAVINTQLRTIVATPLRASFVSYIGGTLCCLIALLVTRQSLNVFDPAIRTSPWLWTGGLYGLIYVSIAIWLIPRIGSAAVFALFVAGQMFASLVFDQVGLFGMEIRHVSLEKVFGVACLVAGVVLVRR